MMLYAMHEAQRALFGPWNYGAEFVAQMFSEPDSWMSHLPGAGRMAAAAELTYRVGKEYEKPAFGIHSVKAHGHDVAVLESTELDLPFCRLRKFQRYADDGAAIEAMQKDPVVLVVAPLSGHHATLLRDTVRTLLQDHNVYITDWVDARMVPAEVGVFGLDDYVAYVQQFLRHLGTERVHVLAVCQPVVPVLGATALMASAGEAVPRSLSLMGGPIDPSLSPTQVNGLATRQPLAWFRHALISEVPAKYPGHGRLVYPGFLQHTGFVAMNPGHHIQSHWDFYRSLLRGDQEDAETHRKFYDEYNAVLDMAAEYYLETIDVVFKRQLLPKGQWEVAGKPVRPGDIKDCALLTIEGEHDDISGRGQTDAAQALCSGIPKRNKHSLLAPDVGHYGIFSGRRWREKTYPVLRDFIRRYQAA